MPPPRTSPSAPYTYTDQDRNPSDTITWDLSGTDETHFNIGRATGVLSFDMRPDYENPFGADNVYVIVVEADDGQGGVGTYNVVVGVTNVDETPEITGGSDTPSFAEIEWDANMADLVVETFTARDEEGEAITWSRDGADASDFNIDSTTGVLSFAQRPNYEASTDSSPRDNVYDIIVKATDATPTPNTREFPVAVTVTNVDETPEIDGPDDNLNFRETPYDSLGTPNVATFTARRTRRTRTSPGASPGTTRATSPSRRTPSPVLASLPSTIRPTSRSRRTTTRATPTNSPCRRMTARTPGPGPTPLPSPTSTKRRS